MTWTRVSKDHWQNSSDKHLFYDAEARLLCTEVWENDKFITMVVIPKAVLEQMFEENRYHLVPEAEFLAARRLIERFVDNADTNKNWQRYKLSNAPAHLLEEINKQKLKLNIQSGLLKRVRNDYDNTVNLLMAMEHTVQSLDLKVSVLESQLSRAKDEKEKILNAGIKEVSSLKEEIARLKEKCDES